MQQNMLCKKRQQREATTFRSRAKRRRRRRRSAFSAIIMKSSLLLVAVLCCCLIASTSSEAQNSNNQNNNQNNNDKNNYYNYNYNRDYNENYNQRHSLVQPEWLAHIKDQEEESISAPPSSSSPSLSAFEETTNRIDGLLLDASAYTTTTARATDSKVDDDDDDDDADDDINTVKFNQRHSTTPLDFIKSRRAASVQEEHEALLNSNKHRRHQEQQPGGAAYRLARGRHQRQRHQPKSGRLRKRHNSATTTTTSDSYYLNNQGADRPLVATSKGLVRGITQKIFTGKFVDAFLGIPFAQPPTGAYRFRHPQPVNPWPGQFDASRMSNSCYQVNDTFFGANFMGTSIWNANTPLDEDCLYLNIWTPFGVANTTSMSQSISGAAAAAAAPTSGLGASSSNFNSNARNSQFHHNHGQQQQQQQQQQHDAKRPVLVWIFGGGFYSGTSTLRLYEGGALASEEDIIVVSMNYRVSALGFLYFGRPDAPGNAGLFDQLLALQWINDNIGQFGGDPNRVTIFGESAGAVSVAFHLLSPLSRNLFSQAILQSGAATCPWGSMDSREIIANGLQLAAHLKCPANETDLDAVIACLLKADPMALVSQEVGRTGSVLNFPFVPVVDGSFLLEPPAESLANANFKRARILLGSNNDEANAFLIYLPEFSICPTGSGSTPLSGDSVAVQVVSSSIDTSTTSATGTLDDTTAAAAAGASTSGQGSESQELRESSLVPSGDFESIELVSLGRQTAAASGDFRGHNATTFGEHENVEHPGGSRTVTKQQQQQQQQQQSSKTNQSQNLKQQQHLYDQQQQHQQQQDDSKPCKPNEFLSLSRDKFLAMLNEELNPYAGHPIGKKAIVFEYSNWNNPQDPVSYYDAIDKIVGDYYFTCHVNEFAQRYAQAGNPVYMYYFKHRSSMSPWPKWMGVLHADEINFVFGEPLNPIYNYTFKEIELSKRMMKYWANFAKFG